MTLAVQQQLMQQLQALQQVFPNLQVIGHDVIGGTEEQNRAAIRRLDRELAIRRQAEKRAGQPRHNAANNCRRQLFPE